MDSQTMMLLGMVKMKHPEADHFEMIEARGFDVLGFLFPFVRGFFGAIETKVKILYLFTFWAYPIWCWYMGFNYKKLAFEAKLKSGWTVHTDEKKQAA